MDVFNLSTVGIGISGPSGFWLRCVCREDDVVWARQHRQRNDYYHAMLENLPGVIAASFDRELRYLVVEGQGLQLLRI